MKLTTAFLLTVVFLIVHIIVVVKYIQFEQNCGGNLKRAADANTIDIAKTELKTALNYIETNNLTTGYTSVLWKTPDEDMGFWYNNLRTAYNELDSLAKDADAMSKSNMLMKLRETLIDHGDKGDDITVPDGISRHPNNLTWGLLSLISTLLMSISWMYFSLDDF